MNTGHTSRARTIVASTSLAGLTLIAGGLCLWLSVASAKPSRAQFSVTAVPTEEGGIGGIIIVDFIDMEREKNRDKVYHALVDAMSSDKARTRISRVSDLGLIEISRERVREDLLRSLSEPCHYCDGRGYTKSPMSVAYEIFREVRRLGHEIEQQRVVVGAHPAVALLLQEQEQPGVEELERRYSAKILVTPDDRLHLEQFDLVVI